MDDKNVDREQALLAGAAAGTAYLAATWLDSKLSSHPFNDVKLLGQIFTTRTPWWQLQGLLSHYAFGSLVAMVYASWGVRSLPGPGWLKGLIFLQIENTLLYPGALLMDKFHAGIKSGQLAPLMSWKTFKGQVVRHIAFGVALGLLYRPRK